MKLEIGEYEEEVETERKSKLELKELENVIIKIKTSGKACGNDQIEPEMIKGLGTKRKV